jgi:outer membrane protein OmpA-like peptidoglycan-associated protein/5-hydroxyisourate hydrolase-like protein (transthyretin family)
MKKSLLIVTIIFAGVFSAFGQLSKGDRCFDMYKYKQAIAYYEKALSSNPKDTDALAHIAASYFILRDYNNAEKYYAQAASVLDASANIHYFYGQVLKCNGKPDEAKKQFLIYSILMPKDSITSKEAIYFCDKSKSHTSYKISTINTINSSHAEFCPALYEDQLVFTSDRQPDIVNMSKDNSTGGNFFKVYASKINHKVYYEPKELSFTINKTESHYNVGPVCFSADGNEMFFTEVASVRKNNFVNQAKIYYCKKSGKGWGSPKAFPFNSDKYAVMDPSLSADGQDLYFSSNMPGGFGGTDIYVSHRNSNGDFLTPQNLGKNINTPGNEAFPYMRKDGVLYFASDRHFNFGGLDLFSTAQINGKWVDVRNLGPDINSSTDDFGICFNSDNRTGYFSSNRADGKGLDDIYTFEFIGDFISLKGAVLLSYDIKDPAPNIKVNLVNDSGRVVNSTMTNNNGNFVFKNLEPDKTYAIKVSDSDSRFMGKHKFYLADTTGKIVSITTIDDRNGGRFSFSKLPADLTKLSKLDAADTKINLAGSLLRGDSSKPISNVKINLVNAKGEVIQSATTNAFGAFVFTQLPPDETYEFRLADEDSKFAPKSKIVLTDKSGNTIKTFYVSNNGKFDFEVLVADTTSLKKMMVEDPQLRLQISNVLLSADKKTPLSNVKLSMVDKDGHVLQSTVTGPNGDFIFTNLPPDKNYTIQVDASDPRISKLGKIYMADNKLLTFRELLLNKGAFKYEMLPSDQKSMGNVYVYDPWIEALNLKNKKSKNDSMYIIENIYYDYEKWDILPAGTHVLDKVVQVMKNDQSIKLELDAFTDPRGSDEFNMDLSQKRADAAVNYMVAHGIAKARVTGKGFGKTHPLNKCGDPNVHCTEEEFAINRRTEFKIIRTTK